MIFLSLLIRVPPNSVIIRQNLVIALTLIVALVLSDLFGLITLPWGVVGHEGSTLLVTLSGLRLLRRIRR
jgi:Cd2+/Zn2+-exporting ATPase